MMPPVPHAIASLSRQTRTIPSSFDTERLTLRAPRPGDGVALNAAILASLAELQPWLPWARPAPSVEQSEEHVIRAAEAFRQQDKLQLLIFLRGTGTLIGSSGFHDIDWTMQKLEIGYWLSTAYVGRGYMTEAVLAQVEFARTALGARRLEIHADDVNWRSWQVAERAGFMLEHTVRCARRGFDGSLRDDRIYSRAF